MAAPHPDPSESVASPCPASRPPSPSCRSASARTVPRQPDPAVRPPHPADRRLGYQGRPPMRERNSLPHSGRSALVPRADSAAPPHGAPPSARPVSARGPNPALGQTDSSARPVRERSFLLRTGRGGRLLGVQVYSSAQPMRERSFLVPSGRGGWVLGAQADSSVLPVSARGPGFPLRSGRVGWGLGAQVDSSVLPLSGRARRFLVRSDRGGTLGAQAGSSVPLAWGPVLRSGRGGSGLAAQPDSSVPPVSARGSAFRCPPGRGGRGLAVRSGVPRAWAVPLSGGLRGRAAGRLVRRADSGGPEGWGCPGPGDWGGRVGWTWGPGGRWRGPGECWPGSGRGGPWGRRGVWRADAAGRGRARRRGECLAWAVRVWRCRPRA